MADVTSAPAASTSTSTLSDWAGPYVTSMLGKAQALGSNPYPIYGGALTAGPSSLQSAAFQGIGALALPQATTSYSPGTFGLQDMNTGPANIGLSANTTGYSPTTYNTFLPGSSAANPGGVGDVQSYMNPYLSGILAPQVRELQRQADIARVNNAGRMAKAGSYGGSRQAIQEAELDRNLLTSVGDVTGKAYTNAFDNAQNMQLKAAQMGLDAQKGTDLSKQFGANLGLDVGKFGLQSLQSDRDQAYKAGALGLDAAKAAEAAKQFGANLGLDAGKFNMSVLDQALRAGETQRGIEQQGLTADYNEFARQRDYPQEMLTFQKSLLSGLPLSTVSNTPNTSGIQNLAGAVSGVSDLLDLLKDLGIK